MSCTLFKLWMLVMATLAVVIVFGVVAERIGKRFGERLAEVAIFVYMVLLVVGFFGVAAGYMLGWLE